MTVEIVAVTWLPVIFMSSTPDIVGKDIMFLGWAISMKLTKNILLPLLMTWLDCIYRSEIKFTTGHRGGEGVHVNASRSHIF